MGFTDWKDEIQFKLQELYGEESSTPNIEGLVKLIAFLDDDDAQGLKADQSYCSPYYRGLKNARGGFFKSYADGLIKDIEENNRNPNFMAQMRTIYEQMEDPQARIIPAPGTLEEAIIPKTGMSLGGLTGLIKTYETMPPATQTAVLNVIRRYATGQIIRSVDDVVSLVNTTGGSVVMVGLAALSITWECYQNIRKWWNGEISGRRCAKNVIDSIAEIAAGVGGGIGGAVVGSAVFPVVGTFIGGIAGGILSSIAARKLSEYITTNIFDLPQTVALENAYKFLGVHHAASNGELNKAFRGKALRFHPDKGGDVEEFHKLQVHFGIIKASKEEVC